MWEGILIALDICKFHIVTFRLTTSYFRRDSFKKKSFLVFDKIRLTFFPFFLSLIDIDL